MRSGIRSNLPAVAAALTCAVAGTPAIAQSDVVVMRRAIAAPRVAAAVQPGATCTLSNQQVYSFVETPTTLKREQVSGWSGTYAQAAVKVKSFCEAQKGVQVCEGLIRTSDPSTIYMRAFSVSVKPQYTSNISLYGNSSGFTGDCVTK